MATRRGSGEGAIYQRADGKWVAALDLGLSDDGRRRRKVVYGKTRTEVRGKLLKVQRESHGRNIATSSPTVAAWFDDWLANAEIRPSTRSSYDSYLRNHIKPTIGTRRLDRLEVAHLRALYAKMRRDGLSDGTIKQVHSVISAALLVAMREGKVPTNVADRSHMKPPKGSDNPRQPLTLEQARAVLAAAEGHKWESRYYMALWQGLRQGETLGLRWENVDLANGVIYVEEALQRVDGKIATIAPKSRHSVRAVPLLTIVSSRLAVDLARQRADGGGQPQDYVWTYKGGPVPAQRDWDAWAALLKTADVPHVALHAARNTASTLMLAAGVPDKLQAELLGHGSVKITQKHYQRGDLTLHRQALAQLEQYVEGQR